MKKLEFKLKTAVGPFIPYKNFYWHRRWPQLVSMSFSDYFSDTTSMVHLNGTSPLTQSLALFASQIAYNTIKTGVETPIPIRTSNTRDYTSAFLTGSSFLTASLYTAEDYIEHSAIYDEDKLPDNFFLGSPAGTNYVSELIHSTNATASFERFKNSGYSNRTKKAWNNARSEVQRFYQGDDPENYSIIKSNKKSDCPNCKFRIKRSLRQNSSGSLRDITLCVAISNDYMPTTNLDMIGPYPWVWSLPYGGLGEHTEDVYTSPSTFSISSFEADNSSRMLRSRLNVQDSREFRFTYDIVSDSLEELSLQEFFASASVVSTAKSFLDAGFDPGRHTMPFDKYFDYGMDKDDYPYIALKSENITALIDPDHESATATTAFSQSVTSDVPSLAPLSPFVSDFSDTKGIFLKVYDCQDGNISAADLFGLEGKKRVGNMKENMFLEEAVLAIPMIENDNSVSAPLQVDRETVLNRMKYLQKDGQLRFKYFKDSELSGITLNRNTEDSDPPNAVDDYILASEKYVFPPEFDVAKILEDKTWSPFFGVIFEYSKKISRCDRLSLWQGSLTDNLLTSDTVEQTISVPLDLFGENFKFKDKSIRVMLLKVKKRAETNYNVWRSKLLNLKYSPEQDYRLSYNYPYDEFTILPMSELVAKISCVDEKPETSGVDEE